MILIVVIFLVAISILLLSLTFKLLKKPIKWIAKLFIHACMGYVALFLFNFVGAWIDVSLGLNWINALIVGVLGVPGAILLLLIKYFL